MKRLVNLAPTLLVLVVWGLLGNSGAAMSEGAALGTQLSVWWVIPFVGILLSIALFPLFAPHFWHHHYGKIALFWGVALAVPFLITFKGTAWHTILHIYLLEYLPFVILLLALFTVSGGIVIRGAIQGKPVTNSIILLIGMVIASWVGTTGASMLLIRPIIKANKHRVHKTHIVCFFIFLVSNIGGALTPLGDPPLFLGFLKGVPFTWTFELVKEMAVVGGIVLALFFVIDTLYYKKEAAPPPLPTGPEARFGICGGLNFIFLGAIIGAVLMSGSQSLREKLGGFNLGGIHMDTLNVARDVALLAVTIIAFKATKAEYRKANEFSWAPIVEVAKLFAGIFITMAPAIEILKVGEQGALSGLVKSVSHPWHYFWATGLLSSFLDNAPTYVVFFETAGAALMKEGGTSVVQVLIDHHEFLAAVSCGAVFMGANTYIGNAPNFMVKSIAEESGVAMPSFFGYILKYSLPILIPCFVVITFIFFV